MTPDQTEETPEELNKRMIVLPDQPLKLRSVAQRIRNAQQGMGKGLGDVDSK